MNCKHCKGTGRIERTGDGSLYSQIANQTDRCPTCRGSGTLKPDFPTLPGGRVDIDAMNRANCPDVLHGGREEDCQDNDEGA
jgi:DnaJ-class molecular chaperone